MEDEEADLSDVVGGPEEIGRGSIIVGLTQ